MSAAWAAVTTSSASEVTLDCAAINSVSEAPPSATALSFRMLVPFVIPRPATVCEPGNLDSIKSMLQWFWNNARTAFVRRAISHGFEAEHGIIDLKFHLGKELRLQLCVYVLLGIVSLDCAWKQRLCVMIKPIICSVAVCDFCEFWRR